MATPLTLTTVGLPGETAHDATARQAVRGVAANAVATVVCSASPLGDLSLNACVAALDAEIRRVNSGDLSGPEAMLLAEATTLNSMFVRLMLDAVNSEYLEQKDRLMRLALRAQSQCRATLETLALIKNPPSAVFARQANIASGPQQVNNGGLTAQPEAAGLARAGEPEIRKTELLEAARGERLDGGTTGTTGNRNSRMAAVGALDRPANR